MLTNLITSEWNLLVFIVLLAGVAALMAIDYWREASGVRPSDRSGAWGIPPVPTSLVPRPEVSRAVIDLLQNRRGRSVAVTTALQGAGGFGKTVLASIVCTDRRIRSRFRGGVA